MLSSLQYPRLYKTKWCQYGEKCNKKKDLCDYAHSNEEKKEFFGPIQDKMELFGRIKMCIHNQWCFDKNCYHAHDLDELRIRPCKYQSFCYNLSCEKHHYANKNSKNIWRNETMNNNSSFLALKYLSECFLEVEEKLEETKKNMNKLEDNMKQLDQKLEEIEKKIAYEEFLEVELLVFQKQQYDMIRKEIKDIENQISSLDVQEKKSQLSYHPTTSQHVSSSFFIFKRRWGDSSSEEEDNEEDEEEKYINNDTISRTKEQQEQQQWKVVVCKKKKRKI